MLRELPNSVNVPFQAIADDGLLTSVRHTLMVCYAFADKDGFVPLVCDGLRVPGGCAENTIRRHITALEKLNYLVTISRPTRLARDPLRTFALGFALTLRADGTRYDAAHPKRRIGSRAWAAAKRWAPLFG